ncbi:Leucine-responsive regulatory protein [Shimia sp. SK013]|nr:Leucine-responsive regulatory protein [Shimia sp. SK013]
MWVAYLCVCDLLLQLMADLDHIDEHILRELSRDGRISNLALAENVGLSPSACLRRVAALEKTGVISGYRAVLNRAALGTGFVAYVTVGLNQHTKNAQEAFERAMAQAPEVRECHNITGQVEYLLRVEAADLPSYKRFHTEVLGTVEQVHAITSYVVMGSPKDERA